METTPPAEQAEPPKNPLPIYPIRPAELDHFLARQDANLADFIRAQGFDARAQSMILLPGTAGIAGAVLGLGDDRSPAPFGGVVEKLPANTSWHVTEGDFDLEAASLAIELGAYRYSRFKSSARSTAVIVTPSGHVRSRALAGAIGFARDLINTPANILGPTELADAGADLATRFSAHVQRVRGDALQEGYPALAAVGAGSSRSPEMLRFTWGDDPGLPLISLCGKGVCFDSGGYDLKPSAAMLRMKKDMGGAAIALGVAQAVMTLGIGVRLDVRIGCVENSVSGHAMRPLDVLRTRAGHMVEVGNTDAEGRLVLADLLADAAADKPHWLIDFATLTGAARTALGPDLPALFTNDEPLADILLTAGRNAYDPLWRLPLWDGYNAWLDSNIADFNTVGARPMAGAVIAALFLKRFVPDNVHWAHIDAYCWNDHSRPGKPEGGEAHALHAVVTALEALSNPLPQQHTEG